MYICIYVYMYLCIYIYIYIYTYTYIYPLVNSRNSGKSSFLMGQLPISMAIFDSYAEVPEGQMEFHDPN